MLQPRLGSIGVLIGLLTTAVTAGRNRTEIGTSDYQLSSLALDSTLARPQKCPPCFNCLLPAFTCGQYGFCNPYDGQCECPAGWGGQDCLIPQCDSLADGKQRRLRPDGERCECKDGWGGINCNVCKSDNACKGFPLAGTPESLVDDESDVGNMTCYKGGETVFNNHQFCDVTNPGILALLPDRPPQVTFACNTNSSTCEFQFWVDQVESFYCALDNCASQLTPVHDGDIVKYACDKIKCSCIPGRFICGEDGSVDIGEFLDEKIRGPAAFTCNPGKGCKFEEPSMNDLIDEIFGDPYITLECQGGECLHYSQVPGYVRPPKPDNSMWIALSAAAAGLVAIAACATLWYVGRASSGELGKLRLPADESAKLMADHVPAALHFHDISYTLSGSGGIAAGGREAILSGISGRVQPGQVMAILGASGAGKSTLLDILARRAKRGTVSGTTLVNGREVRDSEFRALCGYVDQEDTLMRTLTVYETVLYSALLRLPRDMSIEAKKFRTMETMNELGILGIKDARIGDTGHRSISGGEKRRVSIACELVTSPSILFLDEPTSGLDAYNAFNVIDSLVSLARDYKRTVIFTIHQPRSNIVSLFDQLLVLAQGRVVYSGEATKCGDYLDSVGHPCPAGFNIADYLIDLTSQSKSESRQSSSDDSATIAITQDDHLRDEERGLLGSGSGSGSGGPLSVRSGTAVDETELQTRAGFVKRKTSQLLDAVSGSSRSRPVTPVLTPILAELVEAYPRSDVAEEIAADIDTVTRAELPDVAVENTLLKGRKRASWGTQFRILSGRAFKNLYRDPALLATHYISALILALLSGFLFYHVSNDIPGFQNRLGFFFFTLALFGFSCLSSLGLFHGERVLFMRERANGYYSTFTYFSAKVLFDILPLRLVPPLMFAGIAYPLIGLVPTVPAYWKFMLTLVLFNLTTASVILLLSVAFESIGVASFVGTLIMLFNLLFTGLLINRESVPWYLQWLHTISFFHASFEGMAVNELRYLQLHQYKYGVELDVPAAAILSTFGLRAQSFWWPNISLLGIFFGVFMVWSYMMLHFYVKEKR